MPKKLRDEPIYVAPDILAWRDHNYFPHFEDSRTGLTLDPYNIESKIMIYERQVQEWFLKRAESLIRRKQNDFIVIMVAVAYIEGNEQYRQGASSNHRSRRFFKDGFQRIFHMPETECNNIDKLYTHLRCGLFHNGMSGDMVVLNRNLKKPVVFSDRGTIDINPKLFLKAVSADFTSYIEELRNSNNEALCNNFNCMFSVV